MDIIKKASLVAHLPVINRKLIPLKVEYFIFFGALGCALPFRTVFAKQLGLSGAAIGAIFTIVPFTKSITNPLFGAILDHFKKFRFTLSVVVVLVALSHVLMVLLSPITPRIDQYVIKANLTHYCNDTTFKIIILESNVDALMRNASCKFQCSLCQDGHENRCQKESRNLNMTIDLSTMILRNRSEPILISTQDTNSIYSNTALAKQPDLDAILSCSCRSLASSHLEVCFECVSNDTSYITDSKAEFASFQFWWLFVLIALSSSTFAAVIFLMDAICYEILEGCPHKYGEQRLWGTIGWGIGTFLGGYVNELATGASSIADYTPCFYLLAALCVVNIIPILFLKIENVKYTKNIFKDVGKLFCSIHILCYLLMVFAVGLLSGLIWNYQMWFLEDIGASPLLLGLSMTAECFLAELPCFIIAGWVIKKIGHINCLSVTFLFFGLKYLCFAYMKDPWLSIPVGLLHGPTFGIFFASMTTFGKEHAPAGTEATVQALLAVSFEGIGVAAGCLVGGVGFDILGSRDTLWYTGIASFAFLIINIVLQILLNNCKKLDEIAQRKHLSANPPSSS